MYYHLITDHHLPVSLTKAWDFFSDPRNLSLITPPEMDFRITSSLTPKVYPGQIITYRVKPIWGIAVDWVTEITHVHEPHYFIDTQLHGPYKFWHHEHHFQEVKDGVFMRDVLYYELPLGFLGDWIHRFWVRRQIQYIFNFRGKRLTELFSTVHNGTAQTTKTG
ncbi:MAG: SRPBCC domain-containing protein [Chitinophagales bacterium]|nr:MAG: SRPBCC domain-containing protein [Chitinophagales bacterium]